MSAQIRRERNDYYEILERTQKGTLDITDWLLWFLACLGRALLERRQRLLLNRLLDDRFEGKMTKCFQDTASRDIRDLIEYAILVKDSVGGRSTIYSLKLDGRSDHGASGQPSHP
jgi:Fic family protein